MSFETQILAEAERLLAPVRQLLEAMPAIEAQSVRDSVCQALEDGDSTTAGCIVSRVRLVAEAKAKARADASAKADADAIDAMRRELLSHPHFVRVVHALAVEICALGTTPSMLRDLADDLPRMARKLR